MLQMSQVTVEKCIEIITDFEPSPQGRQLVQLGIDGYHFNKSFFLRATAYML